MAMSRCLFLCCLVAEFVYLTALPRRNISTIRYHFTTCGAQGRDGPSYDECRRYYASVDSPLLRDGAFTDANSLDFVGSQSFRPPRSTMYNFTIAAAAGGRGLCNAEFGRGLTLYMNRSLNAYMDYLILVGQKGLGPCDVKEYSSDIFMRLCQNPPRDEASANWCRDEYVQWVRNQSDLDATRTLRLGGGAGGGGASFIGESDIRLLGDARVSGLTGGGGGTSAILNYTSLDDLVPGTSEKNVTLYQSFINGQPQRSNPNITDNFALRGYRVESSYTAGAGAGIFENSSHNLHQSDGRAIGRIEDFAIGGLQCSRNDFSLIPLELRYGDGGFGGGGAGCGGGGGGGGVTGGAVLAAENTVPGGGGYTFTISDLNRVAITTDNEGDGYVDIVAADCGCSYQCVVYEEEDQFQCLCPDHTLMAPDLSDCYLDLVHSIRVLDEEETSLVQVGDLNVRLIETGNTTVLYSMTALLQSESEVGLCAIAFLGDRITNIVAVTEPIGGAGRVENISLTTLNETDGSYKFSDYVTWLPEPPIVTGALLIGTHGCSIADDVMNVTVSIRAELDTTVMEILSLENGGIDTHTAIINFLQSNNDTLQKFMNAILMTTTETDSNESSLSQLQMILIITCATVAGCFCSCVFLAVAFCTCRRLQKNRKGEWSPPPGNIASIQGAASTSTLLSNHAYGRYSVAHSRIVRSRPKRPSQTSNQLSDPQHEYDVLTYSRGSGSGGQSLSLPSSSGNSLSLQMSPPTSPIPLLSARSELRDAVFESSAVLSPKFEHSAPFHNFSDFNRARADSESLQWQYPRSNLVYLRELGEGQFGKVLLMKTQGIAGYKGSIPVAVKTLSSQEPEVVRKFLEEAELMKKFSHPNIVSILGVCTDDVDETSAPLMIMEYMQFGDLLSFLQTYRPTEGSTKQVIKEEHFFCFATDVAQAMEFLANSKFVHRDIAARNCLVGTNLVVKIADFGLARGVHDKDYYRVAGSQILPIRAMSPESLLYGIFTTASDVWSYGVLLWEIVTYGEIPLKGYTTEDVIQEAHDQTLRYEPPSSCPPLLSSLISQCHHHDPNQRPSFTDILSQLPS